MSKKDQQYIDSVLSYISCADDLKKRIREDLVISLAEKRQHDFNRSAEELLGSPYEVAKEFIENLDLSHSQNIRNSKRVMRGKEYKSKTSLLGVPLVHVNLTSPKAVAKGIIALGPISLGLISVGFLPVGLICIGFVPLSILFSLGYISFSTGIAVGGIAIAYGLAIGGIALANIAAVGGIAKASVFSIGGLAGADIAIGGKIKCIVGLYTQSGTGELLYNYDTTPLIEVVDVFKDKIIEVKGELPYWHELILNFIS